ncbi:MAG: regulatory protein RecX [Bacteroidales bacterium]
MKTKLQAFHLQESIYEAIINKLIKENYLNEERFAKMFASGKLRINKWGKNKIYRALQEKRVPELFILEGLNEIEDTEYIEVLRKIISRKSNEISETNLNKRNQKLAKFAISKGFEPSLVWDVLNFRS